MMIELNASTIALLIGIAGGVVSIIQSIHGMRKSQEELIKQQAIRDKDTTDRLDRLEKSVASHNSYAEKFTSLTETIIKMETDLAWIKNSMEK